MRIALGHRFAWLTVCLLAFGLTGFVRAADEQMPEPKDADMRLYRALADIANHGADLYNNGDRNGCYQLFRGALLTVRLQLSDRPDTLKIIDEGLASAESQPSAGHRAFALREVLLNVRTQIGPKEAAAEKMPVEKGEEKPPAEKGEEKQPAEKGEEKPPVEKGEEKQPARTLWDRLGGEKGVTKIVDDFTDAAKEDPKVNFDRGGKIKLDEEKIAAFKKHLVALISSATGGPIKYAGKGMKEAHTGFGISNEEFDVAADLFKKALEANDVKKEDIEAVMKIIDDLRKDIVEEKKPEEEKPVEKKPVEKKPVEKKPAEGKKPGAEKKPADEEPTDETKPAEKKPGEMVPGKKDEEKKPEKKDEEPLR